MDQETDEDIEAKYYANLHYVDTETVELPKNVSENDTILSNSAKTNKLLSRRYWSKPVSQSIVNPSIDEKLQTENVKFERKESNVKSVTSESKIEQPQKVTDAVVSTPIKNVNGEVVLKHDDVIVMIDVTPNSNNDQSNVNVQLNDSSNTIASQTNSKKKKKKNKKNRHNRFIGEDMESVQHPYVSLLERRQRYMEYNDSDCISSSDIERKQNELITNLMRIRNSVENGASSMSLNQMMHLHENLQNLIKMVPLANLDADVRMQIESYKAGLKDASNLKQARNNLRNMEINDNARHTNQMRSSFVNMPAQNAVLPVNLPSSGAGLKTSTPISSISSITTNKELPDKNVLTPSKSVKKTPVSLKLKPDNVVEIIRLDSSDDESVIEIPVDEAPKPICLDSSEDECEATTSKTEEPKVITKGKLTNNNISKIIPKTTNQQTSPSPSIHSSIHSSTSDDFIQQDANNLKGNFVFNFALHGTDFSNSLNKNVEVPGTSSTDNTKHVFATPKSKKRKSNLLNNSYTVSDSGPITPFTDVYDSESSDIPESIVEIPVTPVLSKRLKKNPLFVSKFSEPSDLTLNITSDKPKVLTEIVDNNNKGSCALPDFVAKVIGPKKSDKKVSHEECSRNMEMFYDCSWGGEVFDHVKLKRQMPNNKQSWEINLADKYNTVEQRHKLTCLRCSRRGHREDRCPTKPKICHMCGVEGHFASRCPKTICLNCGSANSTFSKDCQNCKGWRKKRCKTCNAHGHSTTTCTDLWRRYHLTTDNEIPLVENANRKSDSECYCPGCGQRGHLSADCRSHNSHRLSSLIYNYTPVYIPDGVRNAQPSAENISQNLTNTTKDKDRSTLKRACDSDIKYDSPKRIKPSKIETTTEIQASPERAPVEAVTSQNVTGKSDNNDDQNKSSTQVLLTNASLERLQSTNGVEFLAQLSCKFNCNFKIQPSVLGSILSIKSNHKMLSSVQSELRSWLSKKEIVRDTSAIPSSRSMVVEMLQTELDLLKENTIPLRSLYNTLKRIRCDYQKITLVSGLKSVQANAALNAVNDATRTLNKTLIGKFGFLNGKHYVNKLRQILEILKTLNTNNVEAHMKAELETCYNAVFSIKPRKDYAKLIGKSENAQRRRANRYKKKRQIGLASQ